MLPDTVIGSFVGTGATINIELGFVPNKVTMLNQTTGKSMSWYSTMPAGYGLVGGVGTTAAIVTTGGVSAYNGAPNNGFGFTVGTDSINGNGNTIAYEATRSGPGAK